MTDERDPKVSRRYRELGAEEPPTELAAGILAASRRAAQTAPAPRAADTARNMEQPEPQARSGPDALVKGFAMRRAERGAVEEAPERILERIAELRRQGKQDEADKALAEFRRRYPDYRIAEEMLKKVERRR